MAEVITTDRNGTMGEFKKNEIMQQIKEIQQEKIPLLKQQKLGMLTAIGATFLEELSMKEFELKEKKVLAVHKNAIQTGTINKNGKEKTYYQTRVKGLKTPPRCYSYEGLIEKLYLHYFGEEIAEDYSFKTVFEKALDEKIRTENPKQKTITDYRYSYKAFIKQGEQTDSD